MTSEALRAEIEAVIRYETRIKVGSDYKTTIFTDKAAQSILQLIATSLPEKKNVLSSSAEVQDINDGFNQAIDDFLKLLGGGDDG